MIVSFVRKKKRGQARSTRSRSSFISDPPRLVLEWDDGDKGFVFLLPGELDSTIYESVESVVLTHSDILARIVDCTPLADDDVSSLYDFATEFLESEPLGL